MEYLTLFDLKPIKISLELTISHKSYRV